MSYSDKLTTCAICKNKSFCFEQLELSELDFAEENRTELKFRKGETIAKQGAFVTHILFLQKGLAKLYKENEDGSNLILNIYAGKNLIGLPSLYGDVRMQYSVAALEESTICAIDKQVFEKLIEQNGRFAAAVIDTINKCTMMNFNKLVSLTQKQTHGRFADTLLYLSDEVFHKPRFQLSLTRKDLAEFTGLSVMSVVRVLKDFIQQNIIREEQGELEILNRKKLEQISRAG